MLASPDEPSTFLLVLDVDRGRISVHGDLDRAHVHQFTDAVDVLSRSSVEQWSIDAAEIAFCDAGGLRGLRYAHEVALRAGRSCVVTRPSPRLARLLTLVGPAVFGWSRRDGTPDDCAAVGLLLEASAAGPADRRVDAFASAADGPRDV